MQKNVIISASCETPDSQLNIKVAQSELPAEHGAEITYSCPRKHAKKDVNVKAICQDGRITFTDKVYPPCSKTGTNCLLHDLFY